MTLKDCYQAMQADYDDVLGRMRSERLVQKFTLKFLEDGSFDLLCKSLESGDHDEAFRAAHTIKGMCLNLSFTKLLSSSSALTEALRANQTQGIEPLFEAVKQDYEQTVRAIRDFQASLGA